jgi:DNA segregation ATPase FtsK/SpoIIIE-like protein
MNLLKWLRCIAIASVFAVMLAGFALPGVATAQVAVGISVGFGPPELPVYEQPICPGDGYIWTPGYWAWDEDVQDYYWVPGTWVLAPQVGYLWTPGYWGWGGEGFFFHTGYWGPVVGFYGGIDYGFGYTGHGYYGGRWEHDHFYYNREVNRINEREVRNVYNERVENHYNVTRVSYNGGNGGVNERPTSREEAASRERHIGPVPAQTQHFQAARSNPELRASQNHGKPPIAATSRPGSFSGGGVVAARAGGNYNPPANRGANGNRGDNNTNRPPNADTRSENNNRVENNNRSENNPNRPPNASTRTENNTNRAENNRSYAHASEVPKHSAPENSNANSNAKYQQQQQKLIQKQNQEHQQLQQRQEQEHQKLTQRNAPAPRQQQMEQKHQQQTQQLEQKHQQQQQKVEQHAQPHQQAPPKQSQDKKPH